MQNNPAQQEAIQHTVGPMLLIAGPGSGKTLVITKRIENLIVRHGISPQHILVITFTRAAALEMRARSIAICPQASGVAFGTFHSVFYHILHQNPRFREFTLLGTIEKEKMLRNILAMHGIEQERMALCAEEMKRLLVLCKNSGLDVTVLLTEAGDIIWKKSQIDGTEEGKKELLCQLLQDYQRECRLERKMDFDDMLLYCKELLQVDDVFRREWQERFSYILVDEFQDINQVQYEVLGLLTDCPHNLFAVGDDDQAIYGFRGSDPAFMKRFQTDMPGCRVLHLAHNYRSSKAIVDAAGRCIRHNQNRFAKEITAVSSAEGKFSVLAFTQRKHEDAWMKAYLRQAGTASVAILLRTNQSAAYYEALLEQADIPFLGTGKKKGEKERQYHRETVKDIFAILQFAMGQRKRSLFFRFMNKPDRQISRIAVEEPVSFEKMKARYGNSAEMLQILAKLERQLDFLAGLDPFGAMQYLISVMGYGRYVETCVHRGKQEGDRMLRTLEKLKEQARQHTTMQSFLQWLLWWEAELSHQTDGAQTQKKETEETGVRIMTYHGAKGLEFDTVILPDVREGVVPHGRMLSGEELEEERRMFYVAMTRAKRNLYISYSGDTQAGDVQSIFVKEVREKNQSNSSNSALSRYSSNASETVSYS